MAGSTNVVEVVGSIGRVDAVVVVVATDGCVDVDVGVGVAMSNPPPHADTDPTRMTVRSRVDAR
jgi:hypothetical protein